MTETPDETQEPDAPLVPAEPSPEEQEQEEQEEQEQTLAEAAETHGSRRRSRKKQDEQDSAKPAQTYSPEQIPKLIEKAIREYQAVLSEIVGVDLKGQECPTCDGRGYTIGGKDPGLELQEDETKEACPTCNGLGQLITHSKAPGHELAPCVTCSGLGWRNKPVPAANVTPITPQPTAAPGPVMGFMNPDGSFAPFGQNMPQTVPQSG